MNVMKEQRRRDEEDGNTLGVGRIHPPLYSRRRARLDAAASVQVCAGVRCVSEPGTNTPHDLPPPPTLEGRGSRGTSSPVTPVISEH